MLSIQKALISQTIYIRFLLMTEKCKLLQWLVSNTGLTVTIHSFFYHNNLTPMCPILYPTQQGYLVQKKEKRPNSEEFIIANMEFHPMICPPGSPPAVMVQHTSSTYRGFQIQEFDSFAAAVDEFFSTAESHKIDLKAVQQVNNCPCSFYFRLWNFHLIIIPY